MFYFLSYKMVNEETDINLYGTIYDADNSVVDTIFDQGDMLSIEDVSKYTIIVNKKDSLISNRKPQDKVSAFAIDAGDLFLISPKVEEMFIAKEISNVQLIDVEIKVDKNSSFLGGYKIVNILDKINCSNYEKSDIDFFDDGTIMSISKLVLNEDDIPKNVHVFLLGNYATGIVIVDQFFKDEIESSGLSGFEFFTLDKAGQLY